MRRLLVLPVLSGGLLAGLAAAQPSSAASAAKPTSRPYPGTTCAVFPAGDIWHADVSRLPVARRSAQWLSHMSPTGRLHPDFGPSYGEQSVPYGIPVTVVRAGAAKVPVTFEYAAESDRVRYPLSTRTAIEGGAGATGDRHAVVIDASTCRLYETWATQRVGTRWTAGSGATWDLRSEKLRLLNWTSADAAGLPILPGLLRYDEVRAGNVDHAIRFTTDVTDRAFVWPARHQAGSVSNAAYPPMGARFRLKASYPTVGLRADTGVVLAAMKKHGLVLADNGSPWYFQGTADTRWPPALLDQLTRIPASAFEAVDVSPLRISRDSGAARAG